MTAGVQIWRRDAIDSSRLTLDITSRCLNVFGFVDTGMWIAFNDPEYPPSDQLCYNGDNIFNWRSIYVPEFSYGAPFYNVSYKLIKTVFSQKGDGFRRWVFDELSHVNNDQELMDLLTNDDECYISSLTPDIKIEGNFLKYRYNDEWRDNIFGDDRMFVLIGGFRISYGVL
ncbi:hypothetical protein J3U31_02890 [Gilliamella sp. B3486]|uniref:hypothetical protein n=1 Tax=unclassified Gilliamella TaxID=2685620 RepID=UPI0022698226|nr:MULTISPECIES: hypothetical protein [unclassified Gilliamella]MCX8596818.1 hypothetical protein [Gilliamella sp. B3493]MCX8598547.1 hypothetical protein [Gilliamella sp. B3486]MCX8704534.1 hypothetical protein [Gilliamella sp. B3127]